MRVSAGIVPSHSHDLVQNRSKQEMATQLCQKCKQAHPGRVCDYDEKGECAETVGLNEVAEASNQASKDNESDTEK
jgi:hypothetical protein